MSDSHEKKPHSSEKTSATDTVVEIDSSSLEVIDNTGQHQAVAPPGRFRLHKPLHRRKPQHQLVVSLLHLHPSQ